AYLSRSMRPVTQSTLFPYTTLFRSSAAQLLYTRQSAAMWAGSTFVHGAQAQHECRHQDCDIDTIDVHPFEVHVRAAICARSEQRSEEHTSELQSRSDLVCRLLLEKK